MLECWFGSLQCARIRVGFFTFGSNECWILYYVIECGLDSLLFRIRVGLFTMGSNLCEIIYCVLESVLDYRQWARIRVGFFTICSNVCWVLYYVFKSVFDSLILDRIIV